MLPDDDSSSSPDGTYYQTACLSLFSQSLTNESEDECDVFQCPYSTIHSQEFSDAPSLAQADQPIQEYGLNATYNAPQQAEEPPDSYYDFGSDGTFGASPRADDCVPCSPPNVLEGTYGVLPDVEIGPTGEQDVLPTEADCNLLNCPFASMDSEGLSYLGLVSDDLSDDLANLQWMDRSPIQRSPVDAAMFAEMLLEEPPEPESSAIQRARDQAALLESSFEWPPAEDRQAYIGNTGHQRSWFEQDEQHCVGLAFGTCPEFQDSFELDSDKSFSFAGPSYEGAWTAAPPGVHSPRPTSPFRPPAASSPQGSLFPWKGWEGYKGSFDEPKPSQQIPDQQPIECICDDEGEASDDIDHRPGGPPQGGLQRWGGEQDLRMESPEDRDYQTPVGPPRRDARQVKRWEESPISKDYRTPIEQVMRREQLPLKTPDPQIIECLKNPREYQTPPGQIIPREGYPRPAVQQRMHITYDNFEYIPSPPEPNEEIIRRPVQQPLDRTYDQAPPEPREEIPRIPADQQLMDCICDQAQYQLPPAPSRGVQKKPAGQQRGPLTKQQPAQQLPPRQQPPIERPVSRPQAASKMRPPLRICTQQPAGGPDQVPSKTRMPARQPPTRQPLGRPPVPPTRSQPAPQQISCACPPAQTASKTRLTQGRAPPGPPGRQPPTRPPVPPTRPPVPPTRSQPAPQQISCACPPAQTASRTRLTQGRAPPGPPTRQPLGRPPVPPTRSQPGPQQILCACPPAQTASRTRLTQGRAPPGPPTRQPLGRPPVPPTRSQPAPQQISCACPPAQTTSRTRLTQGRAPPRPPGQQLPGRAPVQTTSKTRMQQQQGQQLPGRAPVQTTSKTRMQQQQVQQPPVRPIAKPASRTRIQQGGAPSRQPQGQQPPSRPLGQPPSKTRLQQGGGPCRPPPGQRPPVRPPLVPTAQMKCTCPPGPTTSKSRLPQPLKAPPVPTTQTECTCPPGPTTSKTRLRQPPVQTSSKSRLQPGGQRPAQQPPGIQRPGAARGPPAVRSQTRVPVSSGTQFSKEQRAVGFQGIQSKPASGTQTRGQLPSAKSAEAPSEVQSQSTSTCRGRCSGVVRDKPQPAEPAPMTQLPRVTTLQVVALPNAEQYQDISPLDVDVIPASPAVGPYSSRGARAGSPARDLSPEWDSCLCEETPNAQSSGVEVPNSRLATAGSLARDLSSEWDSLESTNSRLAMAGSPARDLSSQWDVYMRQDSSGETPDPPLTCSCIAQAGSPARDLSSQWDVYMCQNDDSTDKDDRPVKLANAPEKENADDCNCE